MGRLCWEPLGAYLAATDTVSDGIAHANIAYPKSRALNL